MFGEVSFGFSLQRKCCFVSRELGSSDLSPPAFPRVKKRPAAYGNVPFHPRSLGGSLPDSFPYDLSSFLFLLEADLSVR